MNNNIKNSFNIKDLENLTGIKAHTIRIWEKRYNVLEPLRTDTNIRVYDTANLQKLLNISTLHSFGYKISAISKMPQERIPTLVREILSNQSLVNHVLNNFKLAMLNFDQALFLHTYNSLLKDKSFSDIFYNFLIPLLEEIGMLWQTDTITPAHEHFISYLIKQKLASNTESLPAPAEDKSDSTYVLFLPLNEIHEIGLMFLHYELLQSGYRSIYLGESVPVSSLKDIKKYFSNITFVTYLTVAPPVQEVNNYIEQLKAEILDETTGLRLFGKNAQFIRPEFINDTIKKFGSLKEFTQTLEG